jgi:plastocyanin
MNNTSIIVILLVIVAAIGGGAYLYSMNTVAPVPVVEVPADSSGAAGTMLEGTERDWSDTPDVEINAEADASLSPNTVHYTDTGFSPATLTIKKGTVVTFLNQSDREMWVATDEHPSHTGYAGTSRSEHCAAGGTTAFDQCARGNVYSFTFDKAGTWDYHDHVNAQFGGTVVVTE